MKAIILNSFLTVIALLSLSFFADSQEKNSEMTFFITSIGSGKGADRGGLAGADKHCQALPKPSAPAITPGMHI